MKKEGEFKIDDHDDDREDDKHDEKDRDDDDHDANRQKKRLIWWPVRW